MNAIDFDTQTEALLCPPDYVNPTPKDRYHLVVVGAGSAGLICAIGAAGLGAKVALIEKAAMGGDCLNYGCVPSKALLAYTHAHENATFAEAFEHMRKVRADIAPHDSVQRYSELGVDVFFGDAQFNDAGKICVGDTVFNTRRTVLCTGASASVPPVPGLADVDPLTNESVFSLQDAPRRLAILGGGVIGCELATVFARLGVETHIFEMTPRILPLELEDAAEDVAASLQALGVHLHLGHPVTNVAGDSTQATITSDAGSVEVDRVLVALGRAPNTRNLNLDKAGVELDERGFIRSDDKLRTTNKEIFTAGDCTAKLQFTHHADAQARVVVQNALILPSASTAGFVVPHCTYTQPEIASVGVVKEASDAEHDVYTWDLAELDRSRAQGSGGRVIVVTAKGKDKIEGASIVAPEAGELIAMICILMSNGMGLSAAGKTILPYPTRSEFIKRLADAYNRTRVTPLVSRIFDTWLRVFS